MFHERCMQRVGKFFQCDSCREAAFDLPSSSSDEESEEEEEARTLASVLLTADPVARAAAFDGTGYAGVMAHPYFGNLDWPAVEAGTVVPNFDFFKNLVAKLDTCGTL